MVRDSMSQRGTLIGTGETTATEPSGILARVPRERCAARTEQQGLGCGAKAASAALWLQQMLRNWEEGTGREQQQQQHCPAAATTLLQCSRSDDTASTCLSKEWGKFPQSNPSVPILSSTALPPCSCHPPGTELQPPRLAEPHRPWSSLHGGWAW